MGQPATRRDDTRDPFECLPDIQYNRWMETSSLRLWNQSSAMLQKPPSFDSPFRRHVYASISDNISSIQLLTDLINSLVIRVRLNEQQIAMKRAVLSPIRLLPPELFQHILCLLPQPTFPQSVSVITGWMSVSHQWYNMIKCTPCFWNSIKIDSLAAQPRALSAWLTNAKSSQMAISLDLIRARKGVLEVLSKRCTQWGTVDVTIGKPSPRIAIFGNALIKALKLKELTLNVSDDIPLDFGKEILLPALKIIELRGTRLPECYLPNLTVFRLSHAAFLPSDLSRLCQIAPRLEVISLTNLHNDNTEERQLLPDEINIPTLQTVSFSSGIHTPETRLVTSILTASRTISSVMISISVMPSLPWPELPSLTWLSFELDGNTSFPVTSASLQGGEMRDWWSALPNLKLLTMEMLKTITQGPYWTQMTQFLEPFLAGLLNYPPSDLPCPRLMDIELIFWREPEYDGWVDVLDTLSRERWEPMNECLCVSGNCSYISRILEATLPCTITLFTNGREDTKSCLLVEAAYPEAHAYFEHLRIAKHGSGSGEEEEEEEETERGNSRIQLRGLGKEGDGASSPSWVW